MRFYSTYRFEKITFTLAVSVALTACTTMQQPIETEKSAAESETIVLPAVDQPQHFAVGTEFHWITDGKEAMTKVIAAEDGVSTAQLEDDCQWKFANWRFAPILEWKNCNQTSGYRVIRKSKGSPWPMQVGHSWSHKYTSIPETGNPTKLTYRCKVKTTENVAVPAGEFKAFKVVCEDQSVSNTYWFTPEHAVGIVKHISRTAKTTSMSEFVEMIPLQ